MKIKLLLMVIVLALAAGCSKKNKTEQTDTASTARDTVATTPAVASYRAFGNEPFWSVTIGAEGLHFVSPDDTIGMHFPPIEAVASGDTLRWMAKSDRGVIDVRIWPGSCSDGMSDNTWSYSSNAQLNDMTYIGCAEKK